MALQLGGSDPVELAAAARIGAEFGYDEINLNVGCPSDRVQSGRFGACLMREPALVADCVAAMRAAVDVPVTVKCRLGVDEQEDIRRSATFRRNAVARRLRVLVVHARKAWLQGLSPKENREIPPLGYEWVYRLKREFPQLTIVINGGIVRRTMRCDATAARRRRDARPRGVSRSLCACTASSTRCSARRCRSAMKCCVRLEPYIAGRWRAATRSSTSAATCSACIPANRARVHSGVS